MRLMCRCQMHLLSPEDQDQWLSRQREAHQDIKLGRVLDQLHTGVVHNCLAVLYLRVLLVHLQHSGPSQLIAVSTRLIEVTGEWQPVLASDRSHTLCGSTMHTSP